MTVHFRRNQYQLNSSACGLAGKDADISTNLVMVDCQQCQNTYTYRGSKRKQEALDERARIRAAVEERVTEVLDTLDADHLAVNGIVHTTEPHYAARLWREFMPIAEGWKA